MENKIDFNKEFEHLADWLFYSVSHQIDEVDERLDARICNALPDISMWMLFDPKPRDRFYNRAAMKAASYVIYRNEKALYDNCITERERLSEPIQNELKEVLESLVLPSQKQIDDACKPYSALIEMIFKDQDKILDLRLRSLFGDDMPLVLDGLLDHAKFGGSTTPYYGIYPALRQIFTQPEKQRDYEFFYDGSFLDSFEKAMCDIPKDRTQNPFYWTEKLPETKKRNWIQKIKNIFKNYRLKRKLKAFLKENHNQDYI